MWLFIWSVEWYYHLMIETVLMFVFKYLLVDIIVYGNFYIIYLCNLNVILKKCGIYEWESLVLVHSSVSKNSTIVA